MTRLLVAVLALFAAVPALAATDRVASVTVTRDGSSWTAEYRLHRRAPVWVFTDSVLPRESKVSFRATNWTVETLGVKLERRGWYDVLVADSSAVPDKVTIRFTPFTRDIEAAYDAALAFTDGSVALYGGKFELFPADSPEWVEKLPIDLSSVEAAAAPTRVTMRDSDGPVLLGGKRVDEAVLEGPSAYVLFGPLQPVESEALANRAEWLAALDSRAPAKGLGSAISQLLDGRTMNSKPWARLLELAGVPHRLTPAGSIELQ